VFYLVAFSSATHDIAADGFYMLALTEKQQAFFVGIRSTFFRISMITGQGLLVMLAGFIQTNTGLPKLELEVITKPGVALIETLSPLTSAATVTNAGELRLLASSATLEINPEARAKPEVNALLATAKAWNTTNHFIRARQSITVTDPKSEAPGPSWWTRTVAAPLGNFLRNNFGPETQSKTDLAGNIGAVSLSLSQPPGREIVVTPVFKSGDKSVSLVEGSRLVFDDSNWQQPASRLRRSTACRAPQVSTRCASARNPTDSSTVIAARCRNDRSRRRDSSL
jgi:PAT family beta-lactamase induction signal transducer AmpG